MSNTTLHEAKKQKITSCIAGNTGTDAALWRLSLILKDVAESPNAYIVKREPPGQAAAEDALTGGAGEANLHIRGACSSLQG